MDGSSGKVQFMTRRRGRSIIVNSPSGLDSVPSGRRITIRIRPPIRRSTSRSVRSQRPAPSRPRRSLTLFQVFADDVEQPRPAIALLVDPFRGLGQRLGSQGEPVGPAVDHPGDDARLLERPQVAGDRRLGDREVARHLADGGRSAAEALDDLAPQWMRERAECIVSHSANYIGEGHTPSHPHRRGASHARPQNRQPRGVQR